MNSGCKIETGDWVDPTWTGPEWTPYAEAIAAHYPVQVPWLSTIPTRLTGVIGERRAVLTTPYQHDVLIFGAHINIGSNTQGDNGQTVYLQITHLETGIPWVVPNILAYAPMTAFGGSATQPMPNVRFPDAFFLPKHTRLKLDFTNSQTLPATGGSLTLIGVQLINPLNPNAPEWVDMSNGDRIPVGSRVPWIATIGIGNRTFSAGGILFGLLPFEQSLQFLPSSDCNVEIHDAHCNFFTRDGNSNDPDNVAVKITDMGSHQQWTPNMSPSTGVFGVFTQIYPVLPFTKPYLLKRGHRIQILTQDNSPVVSLTDALVTLRGVRLCEY